MMGRPFAAAAFALVSLAALTAHADVAREQGAFTVDMRGSALFRTNRDYFQHASAFGYDFPGSASGGGSIAVDWEPIRRFSIDLRFGGWTASAERRFSTITLTSATWLLGAKYAVWRQTWPKYNLMAQFEGAFAGGIHALHVSYDDPTLYPAAFDHSRLQPGFRAGADVSLLWRSVGVVVGYAFQWSPASYEDLIGGKVWAGGHEISGGILLRF